jgi:anti-anti-sigma factor
MADFGITSDGPRTFFVNGELDMATVPIMNIAIVDAVARGGPISMDLTDLTFVDSSGVGAILKAAKDLPSGCIVLHGVHEGVGKVTGMMGVDKAQNIHVLPCTLGGLPSAAA